MRRGEKRRVVKRGAAKTLCGRALYRRTLCGQTRRSNAVVKRCGQTRRSNAVVKCCGQTPRSNTVVKRRGQTLWSNAAWSKSERSRAVSARRRRGIECGVCGQARRRRRFLQEHVSLKFDLIGDSEMVSPDEARRILQAPRRITIIIIIIIIIIITIIIIIAGQAPACLVRGGGMGDWMGRKWATGGA